MLDLPLPKIVFFDIDDTLYIKTDHCVPNSTKKALRKLKDKGVIIAIATGRGAGIFPKSIVELIDEVGVDVLVTINGQYCTIKNEPLVDYPLSAEQIDKTTHFLVQQKVGYGYMTADEIVVFYETVPLKTALNSLDIQYRKMALADFEGQAVYQMLAFYDSGDERQLSLGHGLKTVRWHSFGVDILDESGSKARGIRAVLQALNLTAEDAAAVGDGLNDIEMMQLVRTGIAVGNACDELKVVSDVIIPPIWADGIYEGFKTLGWIE